MNNYEKVKIGDLGVACYVNSFNNGLEFNDEKSIPITQTSKVGTPFYMAPEIWRDEVYTTKCDIWSLGVILYELCTK